MDGSAVAISMFTVDPAREAEVAWWQVRIDRAASQQPGFVGSRFATATSSPDLWAAAIAFDGEASLRSWLASPERRRFLDEATDGGFIHDTAADLVLAPGEHPPPDTVVVAHAVRPRAVDDFLAAERALQAAATHAEGFRGAAVFGPGVVPRRWVAVMQFTAAGPLADWLASPARADALARLEPTLDAEIDTFTARTPYGSLVRVTDGVAAVTPDWKSAMTVLLVLYPTVMVLSRFLSPRLTDAGLPSWLGVFVGNVVSVVLLTWVLMPVATTALARWLDPVRGRSPKVTALGVAAVCAGYALSMFVFAIVPVLALGS